MLPSLIAILILGLMFVLLATGMPLGFAMGLSGFLGTLLLIDSHAALALLGQTAYETGLAYNLSVIPMFVLMGYIAGEAGLNKSLYRACNAWLGHRRGGLALATIGACGAFAAICGSSLATAATMAQIALPEMRKYKYDDKLATGAVAAGGTIGILIPPSVVMVIYGLLTETSISELFLAGFIPGILTVFGFMAAISIVTRIDPKLGPPAARTAMPERIRALGSVWGTAVLFLVVIGGLYVGWFSPTEAASVGACGAFLLGLINRRTARQLLRTSLTNTVKTTAMIFTVLIGAILFNNFLILASVPTLVSDWISGLPLGKTAVLLVIVGMYFVLGCLLELAGNDPADDPDRVSDRQGAGLRPGLVRHHHRDGGGARPDHAADRHERLRDQGHGQRRAAGNDLPRRHSVHRCADHPDCRVDRVSSDRTLVAVDHVPVDTRRIGVLVTPSRPARRRLRVCAAVPKSRQAARGSGRPTIGCKGSRLDVRETMDLILIG